MSEWISGVNLPACQVMVGMGIPLHRIPDVRRLFGRDPVGGEGINFEATLRSYLRVRPAAAPLHDFRVGCR